MTAPDRPDPFPVDPVAGALDATVRVPGSKSLTNRALVCAALARGTSHLAGALVADDTEAMISCLRGLGAGIRVDEADGAVEVDGTSGHLRAGPLDLAVHLSGTSARFLLPVLAVGPGPYRLDGAAPLRARPMDHGISAVRALGVEVEERGEPGHLPLVVHGHAVADAVAVPGSLSSQFVSGLLLAAPCYRHRLEVRVEGGQVSAPYVEMTRAVSTAFGAEISALAAGSEGPGHAVEPSGYTAADYAIEPDASSASYAFAAAAICGGRVRVEGLGQDSLQGDLAFVDVLGSMGAEVERGRDFVEVRSTGELHGVDVGLADIPDMAQTLAAVAVFASSPTTVRGVGFIRHHETDRLAAVVAELQRCGVTAAATDDGFVVHPGLPRPATIETYHDHRMAMSFALLGLRVPGVAIVDPRCVAKTFPGYWDLLDELRASAVPAGD